MIQRTSDSKRKLWNACQFKALLSDFLKLSVISTTIPLAIGTVWHSMMDAWWRADPNWRVNNALAEFHEWSAEQQEALDGFSSDRSPVFEQPELNEAGSILLDMIQGYDGVWSHEADVIKMVASEMHLEGPLLTPRGNPSQIISEMYLDKLIQLSNGEHWIGEHKTYGEDLSKWDGIYKPQAASYAYLVREVLGIEVVGVLYDVSRKATAHTHYTWGLLKNLKALRKPKLGQAPSTLTADEFETILIHHGFANRDSGNLVIANRDGSDSPEWYGDVLKQCRHREAVSGHPRFKRVWYRFSPGEIDRVAHEQYTVGADIRRMKKHVSDDLLTQMYFKRAHLRDETASSDSEPDVIDQIHTTWKSWALEEAKRIGHKFPRCQAACNDFFRPCEYMDVCRYMTLDSMVDLRLRALPPREVIDEQQDTTSN